MKESLLAFGRCWQRYRISLVIFFLLVIAVIFIGLHDVGMILGYVATAIIMIELTHRWRKIRNFIILFFASFLGGILLAFLHVEVVTPLVWLLSGANPLESQGFRIFSDIVSLVMIFIGVMGIIIGLAGTIILGIFRLAALKSGRGSAADT